MSSQEQQAWHDDKPATTDSAVAVTTATNESSHLALNHLRPNHQLTEEERSEKKALKRLLKRQTRRRKLEIRLQQATLRRDGPTELLSRKELMEFLEAETQETLKTQPVVFAFDVDSEAHHESSLSSESKNSRQEEANARYEMELFYQIFYSNLLKKQHQEQEIIKVKSTSTVFTPTSTSTCSGKTTSGLKEMKENQIAEARLLLQNMARGTQTEGMFENHNALMGYTRQKFQERACLAISSLSKLDPCRWTNEHQELPDDALKRNMWKKLTSSNGVRSICSIGCGPGGDATGLTKFLEHFAASPLNGTTRTIVERVVFFDWTMDKWKYFLQPLADLLQSQSFVTSADLSFCDVLQSLSADGNMVAQELLLDSPEQLCNIDLFATSYLLTETRGKWHAFYRDLIQIAKPGALFLFAEPKAWQLHTLMEQMETIMDFVWLDSSMHSPLLQALEGRVGPAVLLGMKR